MALLFKIISVALFSTTAGISDHVWDDKCWHQGENPFCIAIYTADSQIGWQDAVGRCRDIGNHLLMIENNMIQEHMDELLENLSDRNNEQAWVAGRLSKNPTLTTLNSEPSEQITVAKNEIHEFNQNESNCLTAKREGDKIVFVMDNCDELNGNLQVVCATDDGCDETGGNFVGEVCYTSLTSGLKSNDDEEDPDWFTAQNMCREMVGSNGELITDVGEDVLSKFLKRDGDGLWLGYSRIHWKWLDDEGKESPMTYFNWTRLEGESDGEYVSVNINDGKWRGNLISTNLRHYICANGTHDSSRTALSERESTAVAWQSNDPDVTTRPTDEPVVNPKSDKTEKSTKWYIYAGATIAGIVIVTGSVLALIFIRRRQKKKTAGRQENSQRGLEPADEAGDDGPTPYAVFGIENLETCRLNQHATTNANIVNSDYSLPFDDLNGQDTKRNVDNGQAKRETDLLSNARPGQNIQAPAVNYIVAPKSRHENCDQVADGANNEDVVIDNPMYGQVVEESRNKRDNNPASYEDVVVDNQNYETM